MRSQVRSAALELYAALGRQALLVKQVGILQANAELLDARLAAGEISAFEATQGHLALTTARMARAEAGARVEAARGQLAQAVAVAAQIRQGDHLVLLVVMAENDQPVAERLAGSADAAQQLGVAALGVFRRQWRLDRHSVLFRVSLQCS